MMEFHAITSDGDSPATMRDAAGTPGGGTRQRPAVSPGGTGGPAAGSDPALELVNVSVDFENGDTSARSRVLVDFSLRVDRGEFLVIVGPSGCGKTTVLNVIIGFVTPSRGRVTVLGKSPREARDRIGYMFANDALLPWRTALGCVEFSLELKGVAKARRAELARRRLASLGLGDVGHLYPSQLSKGMRQRVALARTWVTEPDLLLLDEPFGALDALTRTAVQAEFLGEWQAKRASVAFVTHDLSEAIIMADRIVVMGRGSQIRDEVRVPFPRPRDVAELSGLPEYGDLLKRLTRALTPGQAPMRIPE